MRSTDGHPILVRLNGLTYIRLGGPIMLATCLSSSPTVYHAPHPAVIPDAHHALVHTMVDTRLVLERLGPVQVLYLYRYRDLLLASPAWSMAANSLTSCLHSRETSGPWEKITL